jgi:iron complex outermembrane receptor protein
VVDLFSPGDPLHGPRVMTDAPRGSNVRMRWTATQSNRSETALQIYGDRTDRIGDSLHEEGRSFDVDFQHQLSGTRNEIVWGAGYRHYAAKESSPLGTLQLPPRLSTDLFSAFVQDEVRLPHNVRVTFGSKVQYDREYGAQFQPTLRALWRPSDHQTLWAAATHAVRTPAWIERESVIHLTASADDAGQPVEVIASGSPDVRTEQEKTYELGYRWQLHDRLSVDVATFYEQLSHIINKEEAGSPYRDAAGRLIVPLQFMNADAGTGRGVELAITRHFAERWDVSASYSWLHLADRYRHAEDAQLFQSAPEHQLQLRSFVTLTPHVELDTSAYFIDRVKAHAIPRYVRVDARLAWHPTTSWELSVVGQNLLDDSHREFVNGTTSTPIDRSVYGKVTWRF